MGGAATTTHDTSARVEATRGAGESPLARALVVVPTFNEFDNVEPLCRGVLGAVPDCEILFVDDSSPDGTAAEVGRLSRSTRRVHLLSRERKLGLGGAYLAGFRFALDHGYEVVVTMDGDLSHDPAYLPSLLAATDDYDVAVGSRYVDGGGVRNWALHRRLLSRWANRVARRVLPVGVHDCTSGFRAYRSAVLRRLPLDSIRGQGYSFLEEMSFLVERHGFRPCEVPIVFVDRTRGRSKISPREIFAAVLHVFRLGLSGYRPPQSRQPAPADEERSSPGPLR